MGVWPKELPALRQVSVEVSATRTVYTFEESAVRLVLTFFTPSMPDDLLVMSWPITYVDFTITVIDGEKHDIGLYFEAPAEVCVDDVNQQIMAFRLKVKGLQVMGFGSADQRVLERSGDNLRIDWGHVYLVTRPEQFEDTQISRYNRARERFFASQEWAPDDETEFPAPVNAGWPKLACGTRFKATPGADVSRFLILAYDDRFSVEYHHRKLQPYWRARGMTLADLLHAADSKRDLLWKKGQKFDRALSNSLEKSGGPEYARLANLAYRQCLAAHKLCQDADGTLLYFSKENFSNGCIATVDVTYPSAPFFLLFRPELLRAQLIPILEYAISPRWKFPFAPHDLGCYPLANGQVYGGGEMNETNQMPVEECGNMLILITALCRRAKDWTDARRYAGVLRKWADYLEEFGLDPAEQLCTDDFAGHLARNANLSLKAILGLRCYADICANTGDRKSATHFKAVSARMLKTWEKLARDGEHYSLAFGAAGTWSQKYNLIWDKLLHLQFISRPLINREIAYYRKLQLKYGLPLDSRSAYGKIDWTLWTATLADDAEAFREFVRPIYNWAHKTEARVPLTDWYWTDTGRQVEGFQARSVVGGIFVKLLADEWKKM